MKINRLIWLLFIIGSGVFTSFYGGNISYALFYLAIFVPLISIFYTLYVYLKFKMYQTMANRIIVKGDWTDYSFVIANEDIITYRNVKVNFLRDKSTLETIGDAMRYNLLPGEREGAKTRIKCNYRGEYEVGVASIEITDFFMLFKITYPVRSRLKVIVLPRVVPLEQLRLAPSQADVKNPILYSNYSEEELDMEIRRYYPGDNKKRVHWKVSAKLRELFSRKYQHKPKTQILLYMDMMQIKEEEHKVIAAEDKIMESVLAIANFYANRGTPCQIVYDLNGRKKIDIHSKDQFNAFYKTCAKMEFQSVVAVSKLMEDELFHNKEGVFHVAVTHFLNREIYRSALSVLAQGNTLCILFISDDVSNQTKELISAMKLAGIDLYQIMSGEELREVLS